MSKVISDHDLLQLYRFQELARAMLNGESVHSLEYRATMNYLLHKGYEREVEWIKAAVRQRALNGSMLLDSLIKSGLLRG